MTGEAGLGRARGVGGRWGDDDDAVRTGVCRDVALA